MKKILLLSITSLAMLMADFTLEGSKLTPVSGTTSTVTEPTAPPAQTTAIGGVIPNSIDLIIEDRDGPNIGDPSQCNQSYPQFWAAPQTFPLDGSVQKVNAWYEVTSEGTGASCSPEINTASNTVVELGHISAWVYYENGGWVQFENAAKHGELIYPYGGTRYPVASGDPFQDNTNFKGCTEYAAIRNANLDYQIYKGAVDGYGRYKPEYYWDYHGWSGNQPVINYANRPKAVMVQMYARLAVENPSLPDDRANAKFLIHVASDRKKLDGTTDPGGDIGMSRWKRVTNDWQPFNFLTGGWTRAQFEATNPPIISTP